MTKEIIVNAGELESRVAILENGRLMELHVEREPKIVGNIYKGRVTKVLKGMDAAFVDIGIERNAFLAASDVIPAIDEESGNDHPHGRISRANIPPINQLLQNNQEILVQVVRAPLGTKGARITTRLSLPGRYMVLMLNSGSYVGVSRKIDDPKERKRLRDLANEIRPENYSLIVRTEAEGKSEEELRQDITFLVDMAHRIETKATPAPTPSLVHGDLTLIFRLIRDAFTRDVNRLVIDSPATYENVLELVGMIAPRMKNRVFLYDEAMPIFHTYNVEPEIERTLRRKVWLPSGGSLIIDQAEALTAIDVNTGRFVGSVELAETVLTTNLQAAEEAARQLRLRDLGGIIVVDFIDMDNPRHRAQVTKAFEEALKRDRAKLKVHSISPLGLVEMTRKRTGDSLARLLTEPCPYCSGIGRVQNALTMALRIERELAATAVTHPETEAYLLSAHPRVIGSMLGYEGEAHKDLESYLGHPVFLRIVDEFHPNTYRLDRLTLEQAYAAVKRVEEGEVIEGQVVNPDPEVSLAPLMQANGLFIVVPDLDAPVGSRVKVRIKEAGTSLAIAEPLAAELRSIRVEEPPLALQRPPLVAESILPAYLREERAITPPRGLQLLSPTAEAVPEPVVEEEVIFTPASTLVESSNARRTRKPRRRRRGPDEVGEPEAAPEQISVTGELAEAVTPVEAVPEATAELPAETLSASARRRRRRRRGRGTTATGETVSAEAVVEALPETEAVALEPVATPAEAIEEATPLVSKEDKPSRRRRGGRRRRAAEPTATLAEPAELSALPILEPAAPVAELILEAISAEAATQAMLGFINAISQTEPVAAEPEEAAPVATAEEPAIAEPSADVMETPTPAPEPVTEEKPRRRRASRRPKKITEEAATPAEAMEEPAIETATVMPIEVAAEEALVIAEPTPEVPAPTETPEADAEAEEKPKRRRRAATGTTPRRRTRKATTEEPSVEPVTETTTEPPAAE